MGKGLQLESPRVKGLQMEPSGNYRRIPFNTGSGLQMEPPRDDDETSIEFDKLEAGKNIIERQMVNETT